MLVVEHSRTERGVDSRTESNIGRWAFLFAMALIAVQPTLSSASAPVLAVSDVLLAITLVTNLAIPKLPPSARPPVLIIGVALVLGWLVAELQSPENMIFQSLDKHGGSTGQWATVRLAGYLIVVLYLAFAFHYGKDPEFIQQAIRLFVFVTLFVNLLLLRGMPTRPQLLRVLPDKWPSRLSGGLYDPNANGAALTCCLLLVGFGGAVVARRLIVRGALIVALTYCLVQTFSRGAMVSLAVAVIAISVISLRRRPAIIAGALFSGAFVYIGLDYFGVVSDAMAEYSARPDSSLDNRMFYIQDAIRAFWDNPFLGAGLGAATQRNGAVVHASLFWLMGDVGILGLVGAGLLLLLCLRTAIVLILANRGVGVAGALIAMVISSFSFEALYQRYWWALLGFGLALARDHIGRNK